MHKKTNRCRLAQALQLTLQCEPECQLLQVEDCRRGSLCFPGGGFKSCQGRVCRTGEGHSMIRRAGPGQGRLRGCSQSRRGERTAFPGTRPGSSRAARRSRRPSGSTCAAGAGGPEAEGRGGEADDASRRGPPAAGHSPAVAPEGGAAEGQRGPRGRPGR